MKELTIEQKAQRYDEAIEKLRDFYRDYDTVSCLIDVKEELANIFPELNESKESEDERIRKELIEQVVYIIPNDDEVDSEGNVLPTYQKRIDKYRAWLEKQGEQKPNPCDECVNRKGCINCENGELREIEQKHTDKVEPKFHEGEWITNGDYTWKIVEVKPLDYILQSQDGNIVDDTISHVDEQFHSFTMEDAKDGNVLQLGVVTAIFQKYIGNKNCKCYCSVCDGEFEILSQDGIDNSYGCHNAIPATKEQRDTLIKAMADAGWKFDFDKKELKKINSDLTEFENALADICRGWIGEELGWKDYIIKNSFPLLELAKKQFDKYEQKSAWSEEDERYLSYAIHAVEDMLGNNGRNTVTWLKSLKDRHTWKPTEEQMKILNEVLNFAANHESPYWNDYIFGTLNNLIRQLKKLKG